MPWLVTLLLRNVNMFGQVIPVLVVNIIAIDFCVHITCLVNHTIKKQLHKLNARILGFGFYFSTRNYTLMASW